MQKLLLFCCFLGQHSAEAKDYTSQQLAAGLTNMDHLVRLRGSSLLYMDAVWTTVMSPPLVSK